MLSSVISSSSVVSPSSARDGSNNTNGDTNQHSPSSHSLSPGIFPAIQRKPFPKALLLQSNPDRRQKTFIGLTSKRFCVTTPSTPGQAFSLMKFSSLSSSSSSSMMPSSSEFDVMFIDLEGFENENENHSLSQSSTIFSASAMNRNEDQQQQQQHDASISSTFGSSSVASRNRAAVERMTGLQLVQTIRLKEHANLRTFTSLSSSAKDEDESNNNKNKNKPTNQYSRMRDEEIQNDPRLQHLIGMSLEERKLKKERELEQMEADALNEMKRNKRNKEGEEIVEEAIDYSHNEVRQKIELQYTVDQNKKMVDTVRKNRSADIFSSSSLVATSPSAVSAASGASARTVTNVFKEKNSNDDVDHFTIGSNNNNKFKSIEDSVIGNSFISHAFDGKSGGENNQANNNNDDLHAGLLALTQHQQPDPISLRGHSAEKVLYQKHRRIIIGMCTTLPDREKFSDLVIDLKRSIIKPFSKVQPSERDDCYPLFDAVIRYPFKSHIDRLESIFVSKEESMAEFAETPSLKQLSALMADLSERRVGGMLRVCDGPDWRKLTRALQSNKIEETLTLLQPIPKIYKVAKDQFGISTFRTKAAYDDGHGIPQAATTALYRAQADVRRTRERLDLEKDSLIATDSELEASHLRNQDLTAQIEKSLEEQKKLEEKVEFLTSQLARKVLEAQELRRSTGDSIRHAEEANSQYEALCASQVKFSLEKEKMIEGYEGEIARLRQLAGKRGRSVGRSGVGAGGITYSNVGGTAVPVKSTVFSSSATQKEATQKSKDDDAEKKDKDNNCKVTTTAKVQGSSSSGGGGGGGAFRSFNPSQYSSMKQDARCVEVDIGLDAPVYVDLLTESRAKCLEYMKENTELREELFQSQSKIFTLINAHVSNLEELGFIKFSLNSHQETTTNNTNNNQPSELNNNTSFAMKARNRSHDTYFASFRRMNQGTNNNSTQSNVMMNGTALLNNNNNNTKNSNSNPKLLKAESSSSNSNNQHHQHEEPSLPDFTALGMSLTQKFDSVDTNNSNNDDSTSDNNNNQKSSANRMSSGSRKNSTNNDDDVDGFLAASLHRVSSRRNTAVGSASFHINDEKFLRKLQSEQKEHIRNINKKWKSRIQAQNQNYEKHLMEAHDLVSSFTIEENVFNLVKSGSRFSKNIASFDYEKLQEVRTRAEFGDDTVEGALKTDAHAVITQAHLGKTVPRNMNDILDEADLELLLGQHQVKDKQNSTTTDDVDGKPRSSSSRRRSSSSGSRKKDGRSSSNNNNNNVSLRRKLRNAAINIASSQGSGGAASAVINSMIETATNKSREPIRAFLRLRLEGMWNTVRSNTKTAMLDIMTTHSALGAGLERLLSGSGIETTATANYSAPQQATMQQQQQQHAHPQTLVQHAPAPPQTPPPSSLSSSLLTPTQKLGSFSRIGSGSTATAQIGTANNNANANITTTASTPKVLMRREKQQQLAMSLKRLFQDRLVQTLNKLSDSLAEGFSRNVYETYLGAIDVMEKEIHKAVQPVALENTRLATSLLMAKTAVHNQLGIQLQQQREREKHEKEREKEERQKNKEKGGGASGGESTTKESGDSVKPIERQHQQVALTSTGEIKLPEYFGKEVGTRDGWSQTRPVLIRDPMVADIV